MLMVTSDSACTVVFGNDDVDKGSQTTLFENSDKEHTGKNVMISRHRAYEPAGDAGEEDVSNMNV